MKCHKNTSLHAHSWSHKDQNENTNYADVVVEEVLDEVLELVEVDVLVEVELELDVELEVLEELDVLELVEVEDEVDELDEVVVHVNWSACKPCGSDIILF